ncbi:hypothetical protein AB0F81_16805 [Actinoplanes sp. NPDC024001]|uniref:hypothetical protein n=1 Tax=Actinoplanes sp. NPDC024001 TaxID=3154598 RepID=UPI0033FA6DEB
MFGLFATASLSVGLLAGCTTEDDGYGFCSKSDVQFAERLNKLPILDMHPESATPVTRNRNCDHSDGEAYANQVYRSPLARTEIASFYEAALVQDGWKARPNSAVPHGTTRAATGIRCYFKKVDEQFVHFTMDSHVFEIDKYVVEVNGPSVDGWVDYCTPE